jgi:hypothetical protein
MDNDFIEQINSIFEESMESVVAEVEAPKQVWISSVELLAVLEGLMRSVADCMERFENGERSDELRFEGVLLSDTLLTILPHIENEPIFQSRKPDFEWARSWTEGMPTRHDL